MRCYIVKHLNHAIQRYEQKSLRNLIMPHLDARPSSKTAQFIPLQSQHCALQDIPPFALKAAKNSGPVVISAPHGGITYPLDLYPLDEKRLARFRSLEDSGTAVMAELLHSAERPVLSAMLGRGVIDLNRPADALDPLLFDEAIEPLPANSPYSAYVTAGYGVIPRLCANRKALHNSPLCLTTSRELLANYHKAYHVKLGMLLAQAGNEAVLVDIHSMPPRSAGKALPDFIFGDDFGTSLAPHYRTLIEAIMKETPYSYGWNHPYAGGYITKTYGGRNTTYHALQIEVNRALYTSTNHRISLSAIEVIAALLHQIITGIEQYHAASLAAQ